MHLVYFKPFEKPEISYWDFSGLTSNFLEANDKSIPERSPSRPKKRAAIIIFMLSSIQIRPERPINAVARSPAVIKAIGAPRIATGTSEIASLSLIPDIMTRASINPSPPPRA